VAAGLLERPTRLLVLVRVLRMLALGHREPGHDVPAEILSMAVLPEFRRKGIARELVASFVESMDREGVERAKAVTKPEERDAKINPFFEGFGFRFVQRIVRNGQELNLLVRTRPSG
jgi:ribosomal protein S18 acetylase RimI-like enzyme